MVRSPDDVLTLLLPRASDARRARAAHLVGFLREVARSGCADVESGRLEPADLDRALARERLAHARVAVEDLLATHLDACLDADAFLSFPPTRVPYAEAWDVVRAYAADGVAGAIDPPGPGESPLSVAARLATATAAWLQPERARLWGARIAWCAGQAQVARDGWDALAAERAADGGEARERAGDPFADEVAADRAAALLEGGQVRAARELVEGRAGADAARLAGWCRLLLDEEPAGLFDGRPPECALPAALVELRDDRPDWRALLPGTGRPARAPRTHGSAARAPGSPPPGEGHPVPRARPVPRERSTLGACVFGVFVLESPSRVRALRLDVAPALAERCADWLRGHDGSWTDPHAPEHRLLLEADIVVRRADADGPPRGALGPASDVLALAPILGDDGEVIGWLHIECEHHLLPSRARLRAQAAGWAPDVRAARAATSFVRESDEASPIAAEAFHALARALPMKTARRHWWGFELVDGRPRLRAEGGARLRGGSSVDGRAGGEAGGRAVTRALATGGVVAWDEREPRLSLHPESASGFATPVRFGGCAVAVFVIESSRQRDLRSEDRERIGEALGRGALGLVLARFREFHQRRHGRDVTFPVDDPDFALAAQRWAQLAQAEAAVTLHGPAGCGKTILARWLHFESARSAGPLELARGEFAEDLARAGEGSLLVEHVERFGDCEQQELAARLDEPLGGPRLLVALEAAPEALAREGRLHPVLARALERVALRVPPLAERRAELVSWIPGMLARIARDEDQVAPRLADDALALLWRQPWPGNLRELEDVLYKLVLLSTDEVLDGPGLAEVLAPFGLRTAGGPNPRRARLADLLAAVASTRTAGGRVNKTRAAQYLGWDPDTLVARLRERGLDPDDPPAPRPWSRPPEPDDRADA